MSSGSLRMGHLLHVDQGSGGIRSEYDVIREYAPYTLAYLTRAGVNMTDVTPLSAISSIDSLCQGVDEANHLKSDFFLSCHADGFDDPSAHGCEVIYAPGSQRGQRLAELIQTEMEALGLPRHKGAYADERGLLEIKRTDMPAVIVEPLFVTSPSDMALYNKLGPQAIGEAIGRGVVKWLGLAQPTAPTYSTPGKAENGPPSYIIRELQTLCNKHGFKDKNGNSLQVDGMAGSLTASALPLIKRGSDLTDFVSIIQRLLCVSVDGCYGLPPYHGTYDAIVRYQKAKGLSADGIIGQNTWSKLLGL